MKQISFCDLHENQFWEFNERLNFSEGIDCENGIFDWMMQNIPRAVGIKKASLQHDKNGTDYWILRDGLRALSVDLKNRDFCPIDRWKKDDACIETTSVYLGPNNGNWKDEYRQKLGWTLDDSKETDYIVYTWPTDGIKRRFWILPFPFLCMASIRNWREWINTYKELPAVNSTYLTLSCYPPRNVIARAMKALMMGAC